MFLLFTLTISIQKMDEKMFSEYITNGNSTIPYFIMFTNRSCHECRHIEKVFRKTESQSNSIAEFCVVDCNESPNLTSHYEINFFPMFGLFFRKQEISFFGKFQIPSFIKFLVEEISMLLLPINTSWYKNGRKQVIYFANTRIPPPHLAAAFGKYYRYGIDFAMSGNQTIVEQYQNISIPSWFFCDGDRNMTVDHIGNVQLLYKTVNEFFNIKEIEKKVEEIEKKPKKKKFDYNDL